MRPRLVVVLTGTGTEVGKTWLGAALTRLLRTNGLSVAVRKPAQSYEPANLTDAEVLAEAAGEDPGRVCPLHRWYPVPMAPPMAAATLGKPPPTLAELITEIEASWPAERPDVGLVEGAGGVASPLAIDGDAVALAQAIGASAAVLVSRPGLGAINEIRLAERALRPLETVVFINHYEPSDPLHRRNREWLSDLDGLLVCTDPGEVATWIAGRLPPHC